MINQSTALLEQWLQQDFYPSKNARLQAVKQLDLRELCSQILVCTAYFQKPELFTSVTAQVAHHLDFDDKKDQIQTIAEIMSVMAHTKPFILSKASAQASLMLESALSLPQNLISAIDRSTYLPPMVCPPNPVTNNFESGYRTFNDCVVLGKGNGHTGDLALDVINTQNNVELKLDLEFLCSVEEEPVFEIDTIEKHQNWWQFKRESYCMYTMIARQGNRFWLTNKVDKRGRLYSQGYHITTQGTPFKKAMIELANEEIVEGVPNDFKR